MATLISHIKGLAGVRKENNLLRGPALADLPVIENAFLVVEGHQIAGYGSMKDLRHDPADFAFHYDASGRFVLPSWCDSHTHLVFAASRENEFIDKLKGLSYAEIAAKGGGILSSAKKIEAISEDDLYHLSAKRLRELIQMGTGAIEIKSGYGLSLTGELKMLRVIRRLRQNFKMPIRATFLGAHAVPEKYKASRNDYLRLVVEEMLPAVAEEGLADYVDVFCENGFFSPQETIDICNAAKKFGLKPKIHANQLSVSGGVQAGIAVGAVSVDHLESMDAEAIGVLAQSETIGTLLPTAAFFLRMPFQPARQLIDAGCAVAVASDFNPGSSPSGNMNFVVALSCIQMKLLPEEAINAATINGAYAMEAADVAGSIAAGKLANLIITKPVPSLHYLPYAFAHNHIEKVMLAGEWV